MMQSEGTILGAGDARWMPWEPVRSLTSLTLDEVRFSRGFLRADARQWFPRVATAWVPLFERLGVSCEVFEISQHLQFPEDLERVMPIQVAGEAAVLGMDRSSSQHLAEAVVPGADDTAAGIIIDYLERRLLVSLMETWTGETPLACYHLGSAEMEQIEVTGAIQVKLLIGGAPVTFTVGLGVGAVEMFDLQWREQLIKHSARERAVEEELHEFSVDLAELAVPRELLIDYLKGGTIIELELPESDRVIVRLDGEPWAVGKLVRFNDRFAVQIVELQPEPKRTDPRAARVQIELALTDLDEGGRIELQQPGSVLITRQMASPSVSLVISGEEVGVAEVGTIGGHFALHVLPR